MRPRCWVGFPPGGNHYRRFKRGGSVGRRLAPPASGSQIKSNYSWMVLERNMTFLDFRFWGCCLRLMQSSDEAADSCSTWLRFMEMLLENEDSQLSCVYIICSNVTVYRAAHSLDPSRSECVCQWETPVCSPAGRPGFTHRVLPAASSKNSSETTRRNMLLPSLNQSITVNETIGALPLAWL